MQFSTNLVFVQIIMGLILLSLVLLYLKKFVKRGKTKSTLKENNSVLSQKEITLKNMVNFVLEYYRVKNERYDFSKSDLQSICKITEYAYDLKLPPNGIKLLIDTYSEGFGVNSTSISLLEISLKEKVTSENKTK